MAGLLAWLVRRFGQGLAARFTDLADMWAAAGLQNKAKIVIGIYQILTKVDVVYDVVLPDEVRRMINALEVSVSFGVSGVGTPLSCIGLGGYLAYLLLVGATPLVLMLLAFAWGAWRVARGESHVAAR